MNTKDSEVGVSGDEGNVWAELEEEAREFRFSISSTATKCIDGGLGWAVREKC